ncbi:hypothetical protein BJ508DRAFT_410666 [Ascobolus immersus RN42]|uniref:Uncharacterized protein n=1 Tax=Ascobolus immersus RN42 TaxID=1160509 RepID=A0A3N4ILW3_ASCIM|nr:hypothetical protein BJ508DRAFT_410666 [Ascobolus immersus RN42]
MPSFLSPASPSPLTMRSKSETNLVNSLPPPQAHTTSSSPFLLPPSPTTHHNLNTPPSPPRTRRRGRSLRKTALLKPPSANHLSAPLLQPPPVPRKTSSKSTSPRPRPQEPNYLSDSSVTSTSGWQSTLNHAPLYARKDVSDSSADTIFYGWVVLISTWVAFVIGIGSVFGVWDWAWDVTPVNGTAQQGGPCAKWVNETWGVNVSCDAASVSDPSLFGWEAEGGLPIDGYYPALIVLTGIMAWVWVVIAWVGLKYFKHAKIQTPVAAGND